MESYQTEVLPEPSAPNRRRSGLVRFILDILETLILSALLFTGINAVTARIRVDGSSMEPTLRTGEFVMVNKLAYRFGEPSRGDIIIFHYPRDPEQEYIKRVIGVPGDHIQVLGGQVYVNGVPLEEPYIAAPPAYEMGNETVPENQLFVLGDNRNNSSDSHYWGPVPYEYVVGKAMFVYWPPEEWGLIHGPSTATAAAE